MSEAVIAIISYAPGGSRQTGLCQNAVTAYVNALKNLDKSIWRREHNIQKSCKKWLVSHIKVKVKELKCGAEIDMNLSMLTTRSGHMLVSTEDAACQTDSFKYEQPIIRIQRNCTE